MSKLKLAANLKLPVDAVTQAIGILAKRRAGKSYCARRLAEQLYHAGQQIVIADPKGDWWGIRSSADGKTPGLPIVILGGERGDVPLEAGSGEVVAKLAVEERVSILLDLSFLRKHEVATFMTSFLENLYRLKAREIYRTPLMLIVDEADAIAPQSPMKGEERMLGAAEDIVRRGGQRGIGCTLITQRSAVLNKNVLTQIQMLIALRTIAPQDLKAVNAWIDVHGSDAERKTLMESLPALPIGDAWFWSPGWPTVQGIFDRGHVLPIETFDSGATPKPGEKRREPKNVADVDLEALKRQMSATIERAKADDPKLLKARIAELEKAAKKLGAAGGSPPPAKADPAARERAVAAAVRESERQGLAQIRGLEKKLVQAGKTLRQIVELAGGLNLEPLQTLRLPSENMATEMGRLPTARPPARNENDRSGNNSAGSSDERGRSRNNLPRSGDNSAATSGGLSRMQREFLTVLAQHPEGLTKGRLLAIAAYSSNGATSRTFAQFMADGWTTAPQPGSLRVTDAGLAALGPYDPLPDGEELRQLRLRHRALGSFEQKVLEILFARYPDGVAKGEILQEAGYSSNGATSRAFAKLARMGWAEKSTPGSLRAADFFFT